MAAFPKVKTSLQQFLEQEPEQNGTANLDGGTPDDSLHGLECLCDECMPTLNRHATVQAKPAKAPVKVNDKPVEQVAEQQPSTSLDFPKECLYGRLGEMARALSVPLGLAYPALLGCYSVLPEMDEMCDTRINLYVPLIAPVGGAKDIVIQRALRMLRVPEQHVSNCTVVSDRGLMNEIGDRPGDRRNDPRIPGPTKKLLVTKEMGDILTKASLENSTLFGTFTNFWDENRKAVSDAKGRQEADCRLSWIGGIPIKKNAPEEFAEAFGSQSAKGALSRMILGYTDQKFRYKRGWAPPPLPEPVRTTQTTANGIPIKVETFADDIDAPNVSAIDPEAEKMWDEWDSPQDEDGRLRYNLMKVALLTASANHDDVVSVECMRKTIVFMDWEARLRTVFKPGVAGNNPAAKFAEAAINTLTRLGAAWKPVNWKIIANRYKWNERFGGQVVTYGIKNLADAGKLVIMPSPSTGKRGSYIMVNDFTAEGVERIRLAMLENGSKAEDQPRAKRQHIAAMSSIDG